MFLSLMLRIVPERSVYVCFRKRKERRKEGEKEGRKRERGREEEEEGRKRGMEAQKEEGRERRNVQDRFKWSMKTIISSRLLLTVPKLAKAWWDFCLM